MKAVVYDRYGSPDVLSVREVPKPVPTDNQLLVRVHAASINSWDLGMVTGEPFVFRFWGLWKPKHKTPGADVAGVVEQVGRNVSKFKPGDEVFGDLAECGWGAYAEYVSAPDKAFLLKPADMSFEQAASIPQAGALAAQALVTEGRIRSGQKVLINGAGGGVGTFGVQIAKAYGAEVTVVDNASKLDILAALGADHLIDYTREDFTRNGKRYDLIVDVVSNRSPFTYKRSLNPGGAFYMIGGDVSSLLQTGLLGPIISRSGHSHVGILAYEVNKGIDLITRLFSSGKLSPIIDKIFPLTETRQAFQYFASNKFIGKIVITMC